MYGCYVPPVYQMDSLGTAPFLKLKLSDYVQRDIVLNQKTQCASKLSKGFTCNFSGWNKGD